MGEKDFFLVQASIVNRRPSISFVPGPKKKRLHKLIMYVIVLVSTIDL